MSGLSRKYMGLEPVSRREIQMITNRLSKPRKRLEETDSTKVIRESRTMVDGTGRFVGRKRMSSLQIERMVARLCNRQASKEAELEETLEDPDMTQLEQDESVEIVEDEGSADEKQTEKPKNHRKYSILRKDSTIGLKANFNVSFRDSDIQLDIPKLNLDISTKRSDSKAKELANLSRQTSVQKTIDLKPGGESRSLKQDNIKVQKLDVMKSDDKTNKRSAIHRSSSSENFRPAKQDWVRPATSDPTHRSPKLMRRDAQRPATSDSSRSPRQRQSLARVDEVNKQKPDNRGQRVSTSTPCDELLIDRVATYNRSPRGRHELKR